MEHAKRQLRWTINTFCKSRNVKRGRRLLCKKNIHVETFSLQKAGLGGGLRSFIKRNYIAHTAETAISISTLAAQNLSDTFENVFSDKQGLGLARV